MTTTTDSFEDEYNEFDDYDADDERGISGFLVLVIILAMLLTFSFIVYLAYEKGIRKGAQTQLPYIAADPEPVKTVNNANSAVTVENREVYDRFNGETPVQKEVLAPPSEQPIANRGSDEIGRLAAGNQNPVRRGTPDDTPATPARASISDGGRAVISDRDASNQNNSDSASAASDVGSTDLTSLIEQSVSTPAATPTRSEEEPRRPAASVTPTSSSSPQSASQGTVNSGSHVVQVGAFRSEGEADQFWDRMSGRFGDYMDGKSKDIERADLGSRGIYYRLRIAGFNNADQAKTYCSGLKARNQDCLVKSR